MPTSVSAKKSHRQSVTRRLRNRATRSTLRTQVQKCEVALASANAETVAKELPKTARALDRAAAKKLIHRNTAARKKSRLAKKAKALQPAPKTE